MTDLLAELQVSLGAGYTLERELGGGGMSRVFVARENALGRQVVVKLLSPELASTLSVERFTREIQLAAALQEPHIVPVLAAGATREGLPWFTMPLVSGESLRARLQRGPLSLHETMRILRNVAQALAYAHEHGIVHRDIKPENILLSSGTAVVADFGIAKALSASSTHAPGSTLTAVGSSIGTPAYMAPEQAAGDPATDHRADLYAWGVVAYELLSGAHPFARHTTAHAMVTAHMTEAPPPLPSSVSPSLSSVVSGALMKDASARPSSAAELLAMLDAVDVRSGERNVPLAGSGGRASLRHRSALIAMVLTAGVGALAWSMRAASRTTSETTGGARTIPAEAGSVPDAAPIANSLAVLPFDIGADTANAYLAEGLSGELATKLSKLPGVQVRAYASSKAMRGQNAAVAGRELNVGALLMATVQRGDRRLRVNASLVRASDETVIWSDHFDEADAEQFTLQDKLAEAIAGALRIQLSPVDRAAMTRRTTVAPDVYDLVQRARFMNDRFTEESLREGIRLANTAVAKDSTYAPAWAALAEAWGMLGDDYLPPAQILPKLRLAASRALALDPSLSEAHAQQGALLYWYDRRVEDAAIEFQRALTLDSSNYAAAWSYSSLLEHNSSNPDSAYAVLSRGIRINPFSVPLLMPFGGSGVMPRYLSADSSRAYCDRFRRLTSPTYGEMCEAARATVTGDFPRARAVLDRMTLSELTGHDAAFLGQLRARIGDTVGTRAAIARAIDVSRQHYVREDYIAIAYFLIGDREQSIRWWQRASKSNSAGIVYALSPEYTSLRSDPRFLAAIAPPTP